MNTNYIVICLIAVVVIMVFLKLSKKIIGIGVVAVIAACILRYLGVL